MLNQKYKPDLMWRFFFPLLFLALFFLDLTRHIFSFVGSDSPTIYDFIMFSLELYILYFMLNLLTVEYVLAEGKLIVKSLYFRKKVYNLKDIVQISDEGSFSLFKKIPFGINAIILNFINGKALTIIGLKDHFAFLQNLRAVKASENL